MKSLVLLILLSFVATLAYAGFPVKYPQKTINMTGDEFYQWATEENKKAQEKWDNEFKKGIPYYYVSKEIETTKTFGYNSGRTTVTPITINTSPGKSSSIVKRQKQTVPYRYKNPNFSYPGPLTIVNPFIKPKEKWTH